MSYSIRLQLSGHTNSNVVKCMYDKSPLEFYSRIKDNTILKHQINILQFAWPRLNKEDFFAHVCSSSLEKRVWINKLELKLNHSIGIKLSPVEYTDIETTLKRSTLRKFNDIEEVSKYLNQLKYPNNEIDWVFLILKHCNEEKLGLKKNTLYFVQKPPIIEKLFNSENSN